MTPQATGAPPPPLTQKIRKRPQAVEQNLYPAPQLQVGAGFHIYRAIDEATNQGFNIPDTDDGHHILLSFHIKGVCNSNCGGQHSHIALSQSALTEQIWPVGWVEREFLQ